MATSFSAGRIRSNRSEPPTIDKQLVNFITWGCESSAIFFVIYKGGRECQLSDAKTDGMVYCVPLRGFGNSIVIILLLFLSIRCWNNTFNANQQNR